MNVLALQMTIAIEKKKATADNRTWSWGEARKTYLTTIRQRIVKNPEWEDIVTGEAVSDAQRCLLALHQGLFLVEYLQKPACARDQKPEWAGDYNNAVARLQTSLFAQLQAERFLFLVQRQSLLQPGPSLSGSRPGGRSSAATHPCRPAPFCRIFRRHTGIAGGYLLARRPLEGVIK
jgi:hypothetical protein